MALTHAFSTAYDLIKAKVPQDKTFDIFVAEAIKCGTPDDSKYTTYEDAKQYQDENYYYGTGGLQCQKNNINSRSVELFLRHILLDALTQANGADNDDNNENILNTLLTSLINEDVPHLGMLRSSN